MTDNHVTMPLNVPSLDHLTTEELGQLRAKFSAVSREARKKATLVISRAPSLKKPWGRTLGMDKNTTPAERIEIHTEFERALLRVPDAYIAHAWANSLIVLDEACRTELLRRTGSANPRKAIAAAVAAPKPVEPPPAPKAEAPPEPAPPEPAPPEPAKALEGADALEAMFAQAGEDDSV